MSTKTRINNEQRKAFARIVDKTSFVDKELSEIMDKELAKIETKHISNVKSYEAITAKEKKVEEEQERLTKMKEIASEKLKDFGIERDTGDYTNNYEEGGWKLTFTKSNELADKLNGKFTNYKEKLTKRIWASQSVEVAETLVDEFLKRNKNKN